MFDNFLNWLGETLYNALSWIVSFLDICPIKDFLASVSASDPFYLGLAWVNCFIDLGFILSVISAIVGVMLIWYGVSIIARWAKLIGGSE